MAITKTVKDNEVGKFVESLFRSGKAAVEVVESMSMFGDPRIPISLGMIDGVTVDNFTGVNSDIDSSNSEDLISHGGDYDYMPIGGGDTLTLSSSSISDNNAGGIGARKILIKGLEKDTYLPISETINLNGVNNVVTVNEYIRVNNIYVVDTGDARMNIGEISILDTTTELLTVGFIGIDTHNEGHNRAHQFIYTTPSGKTGILMQVAGSLTRGSGSSSIKEATTSLETRLFGMSNFLPYGAVGSRSDGSSVSIIDLNYPIVLPEKTDIKARGCALSNNVQLSLTASIILIDNETYGINISGGL